MDTQQLILNKVFNKGSSSGGYTSQDLANARQDGYNSGYSDGIASVDTSSYYDSGYSDASVVVNSSTEQASVIYASGTSGNKAFIDRYAVAKVVNVKTKQGLYEVWHRVDHQPEGTVLVCNYTIETDSTPTISSTTASIRELESTKYYTINDSNWIDITSEVSNKGGNPSYNGIAFYFGTGNGNNPNTLSYQELGEIQVKCKVTISKTMNSTNSSSSSGAWRMDLIPATSDSSFADYKTNYTDAFDTQSDLNMSTDNYFEVHRTPTNNTDTIEIEEALVTNPNLVYYVVLTYGCTGLGYYANSVTSNFDITITLNN